jgi:cell fate regulator YaaT (PSP1 superfamily)
MAIIIGVRFREVGRVYYFDPGEIRVNKGDRVVVETARGLECGEVVQENTELPEEQIKRPLKQMIRVATREDLRNLENKDQKEAEAFAVCEEKIRKHGLDMKLVNVEYTFDASKIIFHFTADQRVDFRALVRDLAGHFRTRIELRQIGVRDEAKLLGGLGVCGRPFCCSLFMGDFHPVSIKMAKEQGLSLNPTKISGTCGRLMCCLKYEEAAYEDDLKDLPRPGLFIDTPDGRGMVTEVNAISKAVKVKLERRPDAAPQTFQYDAIEGIKRKSALRDDDAPAAPEVRVKVRPEEEPRQDKPSVEPPKPQNRPERPAPADKPAPAEKAEPGEKRGADERRGKNWRERHAPRKQEPAYRQPPPQQQQQRPQQKQQQKPQPQQQRPQQADAKAVPRYGEVRRANAPQQQQNPGGANAHRQPWQRNKGQQGQKKDGKAGT